ncbi:MAG: hypothetical protein KBB86_02905 [Candidatus Pacebacteria bacterium]|nr:hypothetical protein [Candidatus Paceibacterota bacterium]
MDIQKNTKERTLSINFSWDDIDKLKKGESLVGTYEKDACEIDFACIPESLQIDDWTKSDMPTTVKFEHTHKFTIRVSVFKIRYQFGHAIIVSLGQNPFVWRYATIVFPT